MAWNSKNKTRYEKLGYTYTKMKDLFLCKVEDLPDGSSALVLVECDYCGLRYQKKWYRWKQELGLTNTDACSACRGKKMKSSNLLKYGTEDAAHLPEANIRRAQTNIERYGCDNPFGNDDVKTKIKKHWNDLGGESYTQTEECKRKTIQTCLKKYGVPNPGMISPLRGEMNPRWKGGVAHHRQERSTSEYIAWRKAVYERDHFECKACRQHKGCLEAHHLYSWKAYPNLRYNIDNGVTLCKQCHILFHSTYGKKDNTPEQFEEFCIMAKMYAELAGTELSELRDKKLAG